MVVEDSDSMRAQNEPPTAENKDATEEIVKTISTAVQGMTSTARAHLRGLTADECQALFVAAERLLQEHADASRSGHTV